MPVYFADLREGSTFMSSGRTLTAADIMAFAGVSGDFNPLHTDVTWVEANTDFTGPIAHGLLVLAVTSGLRTATVDDWHILAYLSVHRDMKAPCYPGDTIRQRMTIVGLRPSRSDASRGIVTVLCETVNQQGNVVQSGQDVYLVGSAND